MKLQREAQESRGAVLDARAALRRCEGERAHAQQVSAPSACQMFHPRRYKAGVGQSGKTCWSAADE